MYLLKMLETVFKVTPQVKYGVIKEQALPLSENGEL